MRLLLTSGVRAPMLGLAMTLAACGGRMSGSGTLPSSPNTMSANAFMQSITPKTVSPASVPIPRMQGLTGNRPALSLLKPQSAIQPLGFSQLAGVGVWVAGSPDGTFWVLSNAGVASGDKFIYHYVNGGFVNVPGAGIRIAVAPDNTPWVLNAEGGIYHLVNGSFVGIAGGASEISVGSDGSLYAISNAPPGPYGAGIFHYVNGTWTQLAGAGSTVAASIDSGTYPSLNINPGGFYVTNGVGNIYYYNPGTGFEQLPGAAVRLAPTATGGIFALGDPNAANHGIYYNNLATGTWTFMPGYATSLSVTANNVYAVNSAGGIYVSGISPTLAYGAACSSGLTTPVSQTESFSPGTVTFTSATVGGCTASVVFTGITTSGSAAINAQVTAPAGLASLPGSATPVFYTSGTFNNAFTQNNNTIAAETITVPYIVPGAGYYIANWVTPPGGTSTFTGYTNSCNTGTPLAMTISGNTLSLPPQNCGSGAPANGTTPAGTTLTQALVYVPAGNLPPTTSGVAECGAGAPPVSVGPASIVGVTTITASGVGGCSTVTNLSNVLTATGGTYTATLSLTPPAGFPGISSATSAPPGYSVSTFTPVLYETFVLTNFVGTATSNNPGQSFTMYALNSGSNFYLGSWNASGTGSTAQPFSAVQFQGWSNNNNAYNMAYVPLTVTLPNTLSIPPYTCVGPQTACANVTGTAATPLTLTQVSVLGYF